MPKLDFDALEDGGLVAGYSDARGPVYRGVRIEAARVSYPAGGGARPHHHPEEQVMLIVRGRLRVTMDGDLFEIGPGQAFHAPPDVLHEVEALEDVTAISFKSLPPEPVEPSGAPESSG